MNKKFKVYTKQGDCGETSLIGGVRVLKDHSRIEAYGDADELNSWIGLIRDQEIELFIKKSLIEIQDKLFTIESHLASVDKKTGKKIPEIKEGDVATLEKDIDNMDESLPELNSFILPGGCVTASYCHIARTICRRVERRVISLKSEKFTVDPIIIKYINRLSDYLFTLARYLTKKANGTETPWIPRR